MSNLRRKASPRKNDNQTELMMDAPLAWVVYVLCDPRVEDPIQRIRYVGITRVGVESRLVGHISEAKRGIETHRCRWVRVLLSAGLLPIIEEIDPGIADRPRNESEIAWIKHFRGIGCPLTNSTDGGDGVVSPSPEVRFKQSQSQRARWSRPEEREKMMIAFANPEVRSKHSAHAKEAWADEDAKTARIASIKIAQRTPETRAKRSESMKMSWADPETRARHIVATTNSETQAKRTASMKATAQHPETQARYSAASKRSWADPNVRERRRIAADERRANAAKVVKEKSKSARRIAWESLSEEERERFGTFMGYAQHLAWSDPETKEHRRAASMITRARHKKERLE